MERLQICANIAPSNLTDFQKQVCKLNGESESCTWQRSLIIFYLMQYMSLELSFLQALKFVCCCFCVKIEDVLCTLKIWLWSFHLNTIIVFCTQKIFEIISTKKWSFFFMFFPNRISNRFYSFLHIANSHIMIFN